jgi:hypothetical protein
LAAGSLSPEQEKCTIRDARLLVSDDNGMVHFATTQNTPIIEFYPACLVKHWMIPQLARNQIFPVHMDSVQLSVIDAVMSVREKLRGRQKISN